MQDRREQQLRDCWDALSGEALEGCCAQQSLWCAAAGCNKEELGVEGVTTLLSYATPCEVLKSLVCAQSKLVCAELTTSVLLAVQDPSPLGSDSHTVQRPSVLSNELHVTAMTR